MNDNSEKDIQSIEQVHDAPGSGSQQDPDLHNEAPGICTQQNADSDDNAPPESIGFEIPEEKNTQSSHAEEVSSLEVAGSTGMSSKTEFGVKMIFKMRQNNEMSDSSSTSTSSEALEHAMSSEISEKSPESVTSRMEQESLSNPQATSYSPPHFSSSDDDSDVETEVRHFKLRRGRRTFSQCDSPDDSGLDFKIYDSEDKNKKTSKDHANKLKKSLGTATASNVIESVTKYTSSERVSKSDSEISQSKSKKTELSLPLTKTTTKYLTDPLLNKQKNEHKSKKFILKTVKITKFKIIPKSVSTRAEKISGITTDSETSSANVGSSKLGSNREILSGKKSNETELNALRAKLSNSAGNSEFPGSLINIVNNQRHCRIKNAPLQSNKHELISSLSKTSGHTSKSEEPALPTEDTDENHVSQTISKSQHKLENPHINPLDDVSGSNTPKNEGSEIQPTLESPDSFVKDDLSNETKLISDCAKEPLSSQEEKINLHGDSDINEENTRTSCLTNTEGPKLTSDPLPAVFKVPTIRRVPKSRSKSEKYSSPKTEHLGASNSQSPKRPTDLNVGERSGFYSFFPGRDQNNILRHYRSLPNVNAVPRKSENRRSMNCDIARTAVRELFTGKPAPCASISRESRNLNVIGLLAETPPAEEISRDEPNGIVHKACSENAIKKEAKKLRRKLNFSSPQKEKTNDNPILQEFSSSELVEGVSVLCLHDASQPSSDDDRCGRPSTPAERKPATSQIADSPGGALVVKVSFDPETGEADEGTATEGEECQSSARDSQSLLNTSGDASDSPSKRKAEGLENALGSESLCKDAISPRGSDVEILKRPVKKGRLSSELEPNEVEAKSESVTQVKDGRTKEKERGSPSFLTAPSRTSRDSISPSKRKAEELYIEPETHSPRSIDAAKRTKLPTPVVKHPDSDQKSNESAREV